jgi:hypothetical protein
VLLIQLWLVLEAHLQLQVLIRSLTLLPLLVVVMEEYQILLILPKMEVLVVGAVRLMLHTLRLAHLEIHLP